MVETFFAPCAESSDVVSAEPDGCERRDARRRRKMRVKVGKEQKGMGDDIGASGVGSTMVTGAGFC